MAGTVGTFNLNNLFGRWNLYVDVAEPAPVARAAEAGTAPPAAPPRDRLQPASAPQPVETAGARAAPATDVAPAAGRTTTP